MTLKEFIEYFQQDLNDPAPTLMAIEKAMHIMNEEHNTEIKVSIKRDLPCGCPLDYLVFIKRINKKWIQFLNILFLIRLGRR